MLLEARRVEAEAMAERLRARAELPEDPNVVVEDHVLPGCRWGFVTSRPDLYPGPPGKLRLGALVFFHGGGYVLGTLDNEAAPLHPLRRQG